MKSFKLASFKNDFFSMFNFKDERARGRTFILMDSIIGTIRNVFTTGLFYTGFLSMYDISITNVGLLTAIPVIANCFSLFSAPILERFKKRKGLLVAAFIYYFVMYILATTIMPTFVQDPDARMVWFLVLMFLATAVYALFSPGWTTWFCQLYPTENSQRTRYFTYSQVIASITNSSILLFSSVITDAVAGSPFQDTLILGFRYFAFFLALVDAFVLSRMKEVDYPQGEKTSIASVFTLPFRHKKFLLCVLFMFAWNYIANVNSGVWNVHLLNHLNLSYTMINSVSIIYTFVLLALQPAWRRLLRRYSWMKTFGIALLMWAPSELLFFIITPQNAQTLFMPASIWQQAVSVGLNLSYANLLYMNLPKENSTAHIAFYTVGCNIFAFLGMLTGTAISGISGDTSFTFLGMEIFSVQYTVLMRFAVIAAMAYVAVTKWRSFTNNDDIKEIEELEEMERHNKKLR